jgi:hypothetical protein
MEASFDFGEGSETTKGDIVIGIPGECDVTSHELNKCSSPSSLADLSLFSMHIAQREWLDQQAKQNVGNSATVANIPKLRDAIKIHLDAAPCLIVHYGVIENDFESLVLLARSIAEDSENEIPVAFCATGMSGKDFIALENVAATVLNGVSVFYHVEDSVGIRDLGIQLDKCATMARAAKKDISPIHLIVVIDRAAGYVLGGAIRDDSDDRIFITDSSEEDFQIARKANRFELATKYLPQVETMQEASSTIMSKEWEAKMSTHGFRNAHYPSSAIVQAKFPLDQLGFILAFHPFGMSFVIATALLPEKGQQVKKLLESWVNTVLGTPVRFIRAM